MGTEAQAEGPAGASKAQFPAGPAVALVTTRSWAHRAQHSHHQGSGPWPAQTYLRVGGSPQDNSYALRYKLHGGTYEMLKPQQEGAA